MSLVSKTGKKLALFFTLGLVLLGQPAFGQGASPADSEIEALKQRAAALRWLMSTDLCGTNQAAAETLLGTKVAGAPPTSGKPQTPPAANAAPVATDGAAKPLSRKELADQLLKSVVLVIAGKATGSGFFITPNLVVTNSHVASEAGSAKLIVVGRGLDRPYIARLVARTSPKAPGDRDYAILDVKGSPIKEGLPIAASVADLAQVIAAGFPGLLLNNDENYRALIGGDLSAMPDLAMSQGVIMAKQNRDRGLPTLAHSAFISGGNSGGPLVDMCGRVVGINTFISVAVQQASSAGFAIASPDMIAYLQKNGVKPVVQTNSCAE